MVGLASKFGSDWNRLPIVCDADGDLEDVWDRGLRDGFGSGKYVSEVRRRMKEEDRVRTLC